MLLNTNFFFAFFLFLVFKMETYVFFYFQHLQFIYFDYRWQKILFFFFFPFAVSFFVLVCKISSSFIRLIMVGSGFVFNKWLLFACFRFHVVFIRFFYNISCVQFSVFSSFFIYSYATMNISSPAAQFIRIDEYLHRIFVNSILF